MNGKLDSIESQNFDLANKIKELNNNNHNMLEKNKFLEYNN